MTGDRRREDLRTGLKQVEQHASWREVYNALGVDTNQHEQEVDRWER